MKFPFSWLKEFVDISLTPAELAERLNLAGQEVESLAFVGEKIKLITTAKIEKIEKHPNADKLVVTQVFDGKNHHQICTAATNVFEGAVVPVSLPGSVLNSGLQIKPAKLRGVDSNGMLCSEVELGVSEESKGIWILPSDTPLGLDFIDYAHLKDAVLEIAILPNRGDCQSIFGMAREIGSVLGKPLRRPDFSATLSAEKCDVKIESDVFYTGRVLRSVKNGASPMWMQRRLQLCGIRPISLVVDVTNYVLLELGQPLHGFDYHKISGKKITVRKATDGEKMKTLDGEERQLSQGALLVCDASGPVAIGGIMGGLGSEITQNTTDVFLESAYFPAADVRKARMKLALRTESAIRFEKGVDAAMVEPASDRAAHLLQKLGDAKVTATVKTANAPIQKKEMVFIPQKINDLLGSQFSESEMKEILQKLGFEFDGQNIGVPTWRQNDVVEWPCLAEEVARIAGYQRVTSRLPQGAVVMGAHSELENHKQLFEEVLLAEGFYLVNTFPMIAKGTSFHSGLELKNPITPEESVLRNSLLPSLLRVADYNFNRQVEELRIFEIGKVFFERHEETHGAAFFGGKNVDIFALKGIAENILENVSFRPSDLSHFHPKKQLGLYLLDVCVGAVGIVHPSICKDGGYLSINLSALPKQAKKKYAPIAKFPSTRRDIALLAPKNLTYAEIASAISQHKPKLVTEFFMFDYFESEKIGADKKSLAFAFIYQDPERTLSDDEVNQAHEKFSQLLTQKLPLAIR